MKYETLYTQHGIMTNWKILPELSSYSKLNDKHNDKLFKEINIRNKSQ